VHFITVYKTARKAQHKIQHKQMFVFAGDTEELLGQVAPVPYCPN